VSDPRPNIWLLQAQGDSRGLIEALQNSDADVRKRAAAALRALGAVESVMALRRALENETDDDTRNHLDMALNSLLIDQYEAENELGQQTRQLIAQLSSRPRMASANSRTKLPLKRWCCCSTTRSFRRMCA
jgi:HEAT repeat protein